jgi:hypothetical protein
MDNQPPALQNNPDGAGELFEADLVVVVEGKSIAAV